MAERLCQPSAAETQSTCICLLGAVKCMLDIIYTLRKVVPYQCSDSWAFGAGVRAQAPGGPQHALVHAGGAARAGAQREGGHGAHGLREAGGPGQDPLLQHPPPPAPHGPRGQAICPRRGVACTAHVLALDACTPPPHNISALRH